MIITKNVHFWIYCWGKMWRHNCKKTKCISNVSLHEVCNSCLHIKYKEGLLKGMKLHHMTWVLNDNWSYTSERLEKTGACLKLTNKQTDRGVQKFLCSTAVTVLHSFVCKKSDKSRWVKKEIELQTLLNPYFWTRPQTLFKDELLPSQFFFSHP